MSELIPAGAQTYSKAPAQFPELAPKHAVRGRGGVLVGEDGRHYVDWVMALGSTPLGYADSDVITAIMDEVTQGTEFSLSSVLEEQLAGDLVRLIPGAEQVKYGKNGSDVTTAAVRAARALTGRDRVISDGFHGWHDWSCVNPNGIPFLSRSDTVGILWDHPEATQALMSEAAAVIIEPDAAELKQEGALAWLRRQCDQHGAVLIFDEVVTGFRVGLGGCQEKYGVRADLVCLGKAMANGMPLSAVVGPAKFMEPFAGGIGYSMTHGGETLSLAAGRATIAKMERLPVLEHIEQTGILLRDAFNDLAREFGFPLRAGGAHPSRVVIDWPDRAWRTDVSECLLEDGILFAYGFMPCFAHTADLVDQTVQALRRAFQRIAGNGGPQPRGRLVAEPFRKP